MLKRFFYPAMWLLMAANLALIVTTMAQSRGYSLRLNRDAHVTAYQDALRLVHDNYVDADRVDYEELAARALEAMLRDLDSHSEYLRPGAFKDLQDDMRSEFGGIGVQIELRDNEVVVIAPIAGTPGARAGILRGDVIVGVNGDRFEDPTLGKVIRLLRGTPGSRVNVTLRRSSTGEEYDVDIRREKIQVESVRDIRMLDDGIGYVAVVQFAERTPKEFLAALESLEERGMRALVLDLRNNPGGILEAAIGVADPFLQRGDVIVITKGRNRSDNREARARGRSGQRDYPVAIIVNSGSASASEIVAGALGDAGRAVLVGEKTFGKGTVQSVLPLRNGGGLKLTTARYYTPLGASIEKEGIKPHIEVALSDEEEERIALQRLRLELDGREAFIERFGFTPIEDRQLQAAVGVLSEALIETSAGELAAARE